MHVIVVGAGLIGLKSAHALRKLGAAVTLVERLRAPCQGASYSTGAFLGTREPAPIAPETGALGRLKACTGSDDGLIYSSGAALRHPRFVAALAASRTPAAAERFRTVAREMSAQSAALLHADAVNEGIELFESAGTVLLNLDKASKSPTAMEALALESLSQLEPALAAAVGITGASFDAVSSWSPSFYAKQLKERLSADDGVTFRCNTEAQRLLIQDGRAAGIETAAGQIFADSVLVTAGADNDKLVPASALGNAPLAPLTRSMLSVTLRPDASRPRHAVRTPNGRAAVPLEGFLRLMGCWYLGTSETTDPDSEYKALWSLGIQLFPEHANWNEAQYLSRTVLGAPDGLPLAGPTRLPGLFVNIAGGIHGADFCPVTAECSAGAIFGLESRFKDALSPVRFA